MSVIRVCTIYILCACTITADQQSAASDLVQASLEDLMHLEVTSVSKKAQPLLSTPAAVMVLTREDIRRSGATTLPDLLRMVPGLQIARVDSSTWAVSSRGFNGEHSNKMLVLIDGRSVYTPIFSGVYWGVQDTVLEDIERIEVIRGPGATMWGANAVNGVINIITRPAQATQGTMLTVGSGPQERFFSTVRYGGKLRTTHYRIDAKMFDRLAAETPEGLDWRVGRIGFRSDSVFTNGDTLMLQSSVYAGDNGKIYNVPQLQRPYSRKIDTSTDLRGGHALGRWTHQQNESTSLILQAYIDDMRQDDALYKLRARTSDVDFQQRFRVAGRHELLWGGAVRLVDTRLTSPILGDSLGLPKRDKLFSTFAQDDIALVEGKLHLTVGSKFEHNSYTGFEIQPNVRLSWSPTTRHSAWASVGRAVRTPSRVEREFKLDIAAFPGSTGGLTVMQLLGNQSFGAESLLASEIGYRQQVHRTLTIDGTAFFNDYDHLRAIEARQPYPDRTPPARLVLPNQFTNSMKGETYGTEWVAHWAPKDSLDFVGSYTWLSMQLHRDAHRAYFSSESAEGESPRHQFSARAHWTLSPRWDWSAQLYHVGALEKVPSYYRLDTRIGFRVNDHLELSVIGQNLEGSQREFFSVATDQPYRATRNVYGKMTWRF